LFERAPARRAPGTPRARCRERRRRRASRRPRGSRRPSRRNRRPPVAGRRTRPPARRRRSPRSPSPSPPPVLMLGGRGRERQSDVICGAIMTRPTAYIFAKGLQVSGFLTMPWALFQGIAREDMTSELLLLGLGAAVFLWGRRMEAGLEE